MLSLVPDMRRLLVKQYLRWARDCTAFALVCHAFYEDVCAMKCLAHQRIPLQWTAYMATDAQSCLLGYEAVYMNAGIRQASMPDQYEGHVITVYPHRNRQYTLALSGTYDKPRIALAQTETVSMGGMFGGLLVLPVLSRCDDVKNQKAKEQWLVNQFSFDMRTLSTL
jgi:hypothetical protein